MRRPDDCSLMPSQLARIQKEAERALQEASVLGVLPTPVEPVMAAARVQQVFVLILVKKSLTATRVLFGSTAVPAL